MGSRILLADDSITIQKVVNLTFADEGIEVIAVSNGDMAEKRLNDIKPDLVLADIFMPGKNGYELCEAIKQNPHYRNVPVVLLVGAFEPFDQVEAKRVQADAHLTKPFESRTLVETVRRLINSTPRPATGPLATPVAAEERQETVRTTGPIPSLPTSPPMRLDLSAMSPQPDAAASTPALRPTGELTSPSPAALNFDAPAETVVLDSSILLSQNDNLQLTDAQMEEPLGSFDSTDGLLDFEKSESFGSPVPGLSFESDEAAPLDLQQDQPIDWSNTDTPAAQPLETSAEPVWQPMATTPFPLQDAAAFGLHSDVLSEGTQTVASSNTATAILAVDEPLGDVLQNETMLAEPASFPDVLSNDSLGFDLVEPVTEPEPVSESSVERIHLASDPPAREALEVITAAPDEPKAEVVEEVPVAEYAVDLEAEPLESKESEPTVVEDANWTSPHARVNSTAQLDAAVMSIDSLSEPADEPVKVESPEKMFENVSLNQSDEARFVPIDIEAIEVPASSNGSEAAETGFAFSPVAEEQAALKPALPAAQENGSQNGEVSAAVIDEIVRRVVAQMSETVVRDIAWEVVPDCVERVINQLARESLSKRA